MYGNRAHPGLDDAALVRRMRAGDEGAFEEIFKRHHAPLLSYCRHMLSGQDEAEDALQQAFIKAHQALLGGTAPRELRPWLYAIARNCCLSAIAARRGWVGIESLEDRTPSLAGLSDEVRRREDLRELLAGIGRLPEDQRSALLLAELDDLPHQAIATVVGCEVSKVKALIYQARSALIADRDALGTPCQDIREQLSVAHGGELRRSPLRRHLKLCEGCRDFQLALSAQRQSLAAVLPVAPSAGLAAAILGHGVAHATVATGIGGTTGGLASAGGTGAGATATGATAAGGGTGLAAGASAGTVAGGGTSVGALVGGGLVTKLAVGGAVIALATAGAVTVHNREAHASTRGVLHARLAATETGGVRASEIADSSSALVPGSPTTALAAANGSGPGSSTALVSLAEPAGHGSSDPLLTSVGAPAPAAGSPAASAANDPGSTGAQGKGTVGSAPAAARAQHRAALRRRQALLQRKKAELRRRKQALLRRERAAARRARRKALKSKRVAKPPAPAPTPVVTPAPVRARHRKARPTPAPVTAPTPAETTATGAESTGVKAQHHHSTADTGTTDTSTGTTGEETTGGAPTKPHAKKHPIESQTEQPTQEEQPTKDKETQLTNLEGEPEVTGVDVHENPNQTQTGGMRNAS